MSIRLVISDVDGTIVGKDKSVAASTVAAAAKLRAAGIDLSIVSARPPRGMRYIQEQLALTGPIAGYNGGRIEEPDGTVIEDLFVPEAIARTSLALFVARGLQTWLFSGDEWLVQSLDAPHVAHETHTVRFSPSLLHDPEPWMHRVSKMVGVTDEAPFLAEVEQELQILVGDDAQAKRSQTYYLDLTAQQANKGDAVRRLAAASGVPVEEVAVLGDMVNDLPMFAVAGFAVAMGNASDAVKAQAGAVTADNDSGGWAQAIETLILPPRARMTEGAAALARHAAGWLVDRLGETPGTQAVALSGGSTPKLLYQLLAADPFVARVPWNRVHWFWGDERFVPPDDPASNYRMTLEAMFRHVPAPADHIHPIPTTGCSPADAAAAYEDTLRAFHGSGDLSRPLFQIVLLGLGTNGHFASLFPGTPSLEERRAWAVPVTPLAETGPGATPEIDKTRITLTFPALESCRHAAFLVAGADKRDVLAQVRAGQPDLPASHFHPAGTLHWLTDDAAEGR